MLTVVNLSNVDKLRKMLVFLDDMQDPKELRSLPSWKAHTPTGERKGSWSLSVTRNPFDVLTCPRLLYQSEC